MPLRRTGFGLLAVLAFAAPATAAPLPQAPNCPIFPATNVWNKPVNRLPVASNSATIVRSIGATLGLHADFGSGLWNGGPIGIPFDVVDSSTSPSTVAFDYADESDAGPYPIPSNVHIEGGPNATGDRHAILVDKGSCKLYELFDLWPGWSAGSGAIWDLGTNALRPAGWTSADAAGVPILPGLARYSEVAAGTIDHALRFTVRKSRRFYVYPARHYASPYASTSLPPMGLRLRLKGSYPIDTFPPQARVVLRALKRYGMIVADNGSSWYISGAPDAGWDNDQLHTLGRVKGTAFVVVNTKGLRNG
ncbi:MAG: hypothetical protein E6G67_08130 [Actinobacteria bacterium]|nr:MAG: hypothetical protein E6G67_08130 [Actinomycetota bacterium]